MVVLPAYRAARTLERTYRDIPKDVVDDILLVDDASDDDTAALAVRLGIKTFRHPQNRGYGGNQKTCYSQALRAGVIATVRVAGLLHDIGKIGIPDSILRRPGALSDAEQDIVKQHVALGDLIIRDLPDVELIRAGVRHHHERWDGEGYLHRLAGEEIPLIARILAVGDAFSAMTTTRPYRKSLGVREALVRLGDVAGTQLDERLVIAFIRGIETAPDAPLPGVEAPAPVIWTPSLHVA